VDGFFIFVIIKNKMKIYSHHATCTIDRSCFCTEKEKNKRFKTVTTELKTGNFEVLEVEDNLEVYLEKDRNPE
jgi:hypothetical protein